MKSVNLRGMIYKFSIVLFLLMSCTKAENTSDGTSSVQENTASSIDDIAEEEAVYTPTENEVHENLNRRMYVNASAGLRVRNSPNIDGERMGVLGDRMEVTVTREDANIINIDGVDGRWVYLTAENIQGWVFDGYLSNDNYRGEDTDLALFLENTFWSLDMVGEADYTGCIVLRFNIPKDRFGLDNEESDPAYAMTPNGPPFEPWVIGYYAIENGKVLLSPLRTVPKRDYIPETISESLELEHVMLHDSVHFTEGLAGNGITFGARNDNLRPRNGETRNVNGHKLIIIDRQAVIANSNARIRKGPGVDFELLEYAISDEEVLPYIPKGHDVYVLGHTEFTETYNDLTGYWYYVETWVPQIGWVFGPLLDID